MLGCWERSEIFFGTAGRILECLKLNKNLASPMLPTVGALRELNGLRVHHYMTDESEKKC